MGLIQGGFWLQHAYREPAQLVDMADVLTPTAAGRPGVVLTPVGAVDKLRELYQRARGGGQVCLDPCGFFMDHKPHSDVRERTYPWLDASYTRPTDTAGWRTWMQLSLDHQVSAPLLGLAARPSIVITPSPQLTAAASPNELYAVVDAAVDERDACVADGLPEDECWLGIVVDREFLRSEPHLTVLANTVVSLDVPGIVFRCFQNDLAPVSDRRVLEGLREVVEACYANGTRVLLPNAGWVGWLAMAWGGHAFSGGLPKSSWYDRAPSPMTNVPRRDSIFEPQLLRHVRWTVHLELAQLSGFQPCWCPSCQAMGGSWDTDESRQHQIRVANEEGATLRALDRSDRLAVVSDRLDQAIAYRDSLPPTLAARVDAGFLDTWRSLV